MLRYSIVASLAVKVEFMGQESISQTTDMTQTSYIQRSYVYDHTNTKTETKGEI